MKILFQGDSITDAGRDRSDSHNLGDGYPKYASEFIKKAHTQLLTPGIVIQEIAPPTPPANIDIASPSYHLFPFFLLLITFDTPEITAPIANPINNDMKKAYPSLSEFTIELFLQYENKFTTKIEVDRTACSASSALINLQTCGS